MSMSMSMSVGCSKRPVPHWNIPRATPGGSRFILVRVRCEILPHRGSRCRIYPSVRWTWPSVWTEPWRGRGRRGAESEAGFTIFDRSFCSRALRLGFTNLTTTSPRHIAIPLSHFRILSPSPESSRGASSRNSPRPTAHASLVPIRTRGGEAKGRPREREA
jgi:hypothetical protein